jgi:HSP20 family protein
LATTELGSFKDLYANFTIDTYGRAHGKLNGFITLSIVQTSGRWYGIARYTKKYSTDRSMDFFIPLLSLLFLGVMYILITRINQGYSGFLLVSAASVLMIYWVRELKRTVKDEDSKPLPGDVDTKDWVYDLIKNKNEMVFVAEVPGPEEQIDIRLTIGTLHVKSGQNFAKIIPLDLTEEMNISDFKYRNGILTIKINKV